MTIELKSYNQLSRSDFDRYPIWLSVTFVDRGEPWYEASDETTFRPWQGEPPLAQVIRLALLVRCECIFANGVLRHGFCTPPHPEIWDVATDVGAIRPRIFLRSGYVDLWYGGGDGPTAKEKRAFYSDLGAGPAELFPVQCSFAAGLIDDQGFTDTIPGFCHLDDDGKIVVET